MNIYLDDERVPKTEKDWVIIRDANSLINLIIHLGTLPDHISFDHDLGENVKTGYDVVKSIEYHLLSDLINWNPRFTFTVHSANPVGAKNIQSHLDNLINHMNHTQGKSNGEITVSKGLPI